MSIFKKFRGVVKSFQILRADYFLIYWFYRKRNKNLFNAILILLIIAIGAVGIYFFVKFGYQSEIVGFGEYKLPSGEIVPRKTLWDWLELLIIPLVIFGLGYILNSNLKTRDEINTSNNRRDELLRNYFSEYSKLPQNFPDEEFFQFSVNILKAQTMSLLPRLDGERKGFLLQFLVESGLLNLQNTRLQLSRADFSGLNFDYIDIRDVNLHGNNFENSVIDKLTIHDSNFGSGFYRNVSFLGGTFYNTNFEYANFVNANLYQAKFIKCEVGIANFTKAFLRKSSFRNSRVFRANFTKANLKNVDFENAALDMTVFDGAKLQKANFTNVDLNHARFTGAKLNGAILDGANLKGAIISRKQLSKVTSMLGATLPDGTVIES